MLPQDIFPTFSAKVGSMHPFSVPSEDVLSMISQENSNRDILASRGKFDPENTADIAQEALRITKDALNHPDLQSLVPQTGECRICLPSFHDSALSASTDTRYSHFLL